MLLEFTQRQKWGKNTSLPDELCHSTNVIGTGKKKNGYNFIIYMK